MEIIPLALLWLMMPLDPTPPRVHRDDLTRFPAEHVVRRERAAAWGRYQYACGRYEHACAYQTGDADHWQDVKKRAYFAWDMWDDCLRAQRPEEFCHDSPTYRLDRIRSLIGHTNYHAGQLPAVVDVGERRVEPVPLP